MSLGVAPHRCAVSLVGATYASASQIVVDYPIARALPSTDIPHTLFKEGEHP